MAAANPLQSLKADATCPICLEFYKDPVTIDCGHNFCRACILGCPKGLGQALQCPQCRVACARGRLRANRQLQSIVESVRQLSLQAERAEEGGLCQEHEEKLMLFCEEDQKLICVICRESRDYRSHTALPIKEATMEYKDYRSTLSRCEKAKFREPEKIIHEPREAWWNYKGNDGSKRE
ncbi:E3 ubiquitin-protein ligase TRIM39-like [Pleurodeles waltl]|uniref:E3 ubiquitin-protein ligase TRIM39-like n=1 Tax=Pleurodeles waltl TaxID=8319 RepID=UPI003709742C